MSMSELKELSIVVSCCRVNLHSIIIEHMEEDYTEEKEDGCID
jgi:hypothetical protein